MGGSVWSDPNPDELAIGYQQYSQQMANLFWDTRNTPPDGATWIPAGGDYTGTGCLRAVGTDNVWCPAAVADFTNAGVFAGGNLPPGMDGALQAAKQAAQNASKAGRYGPKTTPPPSVTPVNDPPPDLGGWDKFMRLFKEYEFWWDGAGSTIFFIMPAPQFYNPNLNRCGAGNPKCLV